LRKPLLCSWRRRIMRRRIMRRRIEGR